MSVYGRSSFLEFPPLICNLANDFGVQHLTIVILLRFGQFDWTTGVANSLACFHVNDHLFCRSSYASVLTILAFSLERYIAICRPLQELYPDQLPESEYVESSRLYHFKAFPHSTTVSTNFCPHAFSNKKYNFFKKYTSIKASI